LGINGYVWSQKIQVQLKKILFIGLILGFLGSCTSEQDGDYSEVNFKEASDSSLLEMTKRGISNADLRRFKESDSLLQIFSAVRIQPLLDFDYCQSLV
jgi:hypothetical protein